MNMVIYRVSGEVQGVGFRNATKRAADAREILGYAINLNDGRVEVLALGEEAEMQDFDRWLREEGPPRATIEAIEMLEPSDEQQNAIYQDFVTGWE